MAARLAASDPTLWLSRSWTTRPRRPEEPEDAYVFVDRPAFEEAAAAGRFYEWAEFLGDLYGTPELDPPPGADVLLEIDLEGATQVRARRPDACVVLLLPPSPEVQAARLRARGDAEQQVARRVAKGLEEARRGRQLADHVVVNDDVERATEEVAGIVRAVRARRRGLTGPPAAPS